MPKVNVYLPEDLAAAVRQAGLPLSPICQAALAQAVRAHNEARQAAAALRDPAFEPERAREVAVRATEHLRHALQRARDVAGPRAPAESEHLLVGVIDEPDNLGAYVLRSLHVDLAALRQAALAIRRPATRRPGRGRSARPAPAQGGSDELGLGGLAPSARVAVAAALDAASDLRHDFLGCEHLVLGLAEQAEGTAAALLAEHGLTADALRRVIPPALGAAALGYRSARRLPAPGAAGQLADIDRRLAQIEQRLAAGGI